ncbi:MAG TPA: CHAT domain-containing protein [Bryobacteraceae bacterium]|jgi:hypothetical protein|nr:CHAT domain-containing protein [Bryobacteraceae bacterium]
MDRLVICMKGDGTSSTFYVSLATETDIEGMPADIEEKNVLYTLQLDRKLIGADPQSAGDYLMNELCRHRAIEWAILQAIGRDHLVPIFLRVDPGGEAGDEIPWELLFNRKQRFLALSDRFPVVRSRQFMGKRNIERELIHPAGRRPEIRVLAILAAANAAWLYELRALEAAASAGADSGCDVRIQVLHCATPADIRAEADPGSGIQFAPFTDAGDLWNAVERHRPNIIHFFCHGSVKNGPQLHCAKVLYASVPDSRHMVNIAPDDIKGNLSADPHVWMVVLNACSTAKGMSAEARNSFALQLLSVKVPLVIANRVPVEDCDASVMTRSLYPAVVKKVMGSLSNDHRVDWSDCLRSARLALVREHLGELTEVEAAAQNDPWSRPVIYAVPYRFSLRGTEKPDPRSSARDEVREEANGQLRDVTQRFGPPVTGGSTPIASPDTTGGSGAARSESWASYGVQAYSGLAEEDFATGFAREDFI